MSKPRTDKDSIQIIPFSLKNIFPFNDISGEDSDDAQKINEAYKKLFEELIPGFRKKHVQFVLAEVLEIDRKESTSRLLVYSDLEEDERSKLIDEYKSIINSLKDVSQVLISESDAFYITSRIWCAETLGIEQAGKNRGEREWSVSPGAKIAKTGIGLDTNFDIKSEEEKIEATFRTYVERLYSHYLKDYPFAYVLLVPIFLSSMSGRKESLQKLGAVFLHFTTTEQVEPTDLRRIYARTLLFWHYYFTSEAIDSRQRQIQERDAQIGLYKRIDPFLDDIRQGLKDIERPFHLLEAELNPVKGLLFGGEDVAGFFVASGPAVKLDDGLPEITPRHDWMDGDVEPYKTIVAGVLIKALHLEKDIPSGKDLWESVSNILCKSNKLLLKELLKSTPELCSNAPGTEQVERAYMTVKSWFNDSYKQREAAPGLPLDMLEFALRVWECDIKINKKELSSFWVASRFPVETIDALGMIHEKSRIKEATIEIIKSRNPVSRAPLSSCELRLGLLPSNKKAGDLRKLRDSLSKALKEGVEPRGDMTKFLWTLGGRLKFNLVGTQFIGHAEEGGEISIDFMDAKGSSSEMLINWKGRVAI
jgi:hypothetical protein